MSTLKTKARATPHYNKDYFREPAMAILNYTTSIDANKTASEIQKMLAQAGAQAVLTEYDDEGVLSSMSFRMQTPHGMISFRMPVRIEGVYRALCKSSKVPRSKKTKEQAARVAWRILKDWTEAQIALNAASMAEMAEVFLPYAQNHEGTTVYEGLKESNFRQLTHQK